MRSMKKIVLLLILVSAFSCQPKAQSENVKIVSKEQFAEKMNTGDVQLIDVRTANEYAEGHIKNAQNIDVLQAASFKEQIQNLDKEKPIMVYCRSGKRSAKAANILEENGFKNIVDLDGGYLAWKKSNK